MTFNIFKKKEELNYPEEKSSVLDQSFEAGPETNLGPPSDISPVNSIGEIPKKTDKIQEPPVDFRKGFVPLEKMAPPELPTKPMMDSSMSASLRPPIEHRIPSFEREHSFMPETRFKTEKPHVFIRINKYKEVMDSVNEFHHKLSNAKEDLEDLHGLNTEEGHKLKEAAEILLKMEDILRYLETTFTSPEA